MHYFESDPPLKISDVNETSQHQLPFPTHPSYFLFIIRHSNWVVRSISSNLSSRVTPHFVSPSKIFHQNHEVNGSTYVRIGGGHAVEVMCPHAKLDMYRNRHVLEGKKDDKMADLI